MGPGRWVPGSPDPGSPLSVPTLAAMGRAGCTVLEGAQGEVTQGWGLSASVPAPPLCQGSSGPPRTAGQRAGVATSLEDSLCLCKQVGGRPGPLAGDRTSGEDGVRGQAYCLHSSRGCPQGKSTISVLRNFQNSGTLSPCDHHESCAR